jgi:class 3 adenylate cyclase
MVSVALHHACMRTATGIERRTADPPRRRVRSLVDCARSHMAQRLERRPARRGPVDDRPRRPRNAVVVHTDIVGSTRLLEAAGERYPAVLLRHRALIGAVVRSHGGRFLAHAGDGTLAVFDDAGDAIAASVEAQRALAAEPWPGGLDLQVRAAVHAGEIYEVDGEPVGLTVNQGARIMAAAAPGQVVVSAAAVTAASPCGGDVGATSVRYPIADAGWHALRDHDRPVRLRQVVADGLTVVLPADDCAEVSADGRDHGRKPPTAGAALGPRRLTSV